MARRLGSSITTNVDVDIEVDDIIGEISDEDILAEYEKRDLQTSSLVGCDATAAEAAIVALRQGRRLDALTILERALYPKFQSRLDCQAAISELGRGAS